MADVIIKNGLIMTCEPDVLTGAVYPGGALAVTGNTITDIGPTEEVLKRNPGAGKVIDADGRVVMPGFIITHTHMPYVLGHNQPVDVSQLRSFWDMLQKMGWEWLEDLMTGEGIYAATRYAAVKMMKSGTTTVCDLVEAPAALPGPLTYSAKALEEAGIRAQVGYEVTERIPGVSILEKLDPAMAAKGFEENLAFLEKYSAAGGRISGRLGVHTAYTNSFETLKEARRLADAHGCGIQIHIAEIPRAFLVEKYGKSAPAVLEECGLLGPDVVAAHCIDLDDEDMNILQRNKVNVVHTPMTNSLGGNGVARIPEMLDRGMNVSLGHDCFFTLDTAEYIRYNYLVHKIHNANPALIPPFQALDMVLGNAARALGREQEIGSLKKGKKADILIINPDSPSPTTPASLMSYFTMTFQGSHVETVLVDGRVVIQGRTSTLLDEDELRRECVRQAADLWRRNGIEV
ncbi:MAG: amidohydrolase family protein [Spirochaetales bacterium]|nr:amidohydrolase family protein [Spirochaetales bacterium]